MNHVHLIHETYEKGTLILTHVFHAESREKALAYYKAHRKADKFMRECTDKSKYNNKVKCTTRLYWAPVPTVVAGEFGAEEFG